MPEESKVAPPEKAEGEEAPVVDEAASDDEAQPEAGPSTGGESAGKKKKKKSKGKKKATEDAEAAPSAEKVEDAKAKLAKELFNNNVALQEDLKGLSAQQIIDQLKRMKLEELLTGLVSSIGQPATAWDLVADAVLVQQFTKQEGHGQLQILADTARTPIR